MSTQKQKFELFFRLQSLGFTYEESQALRRIEMTLRRWAEAECNGEIQRDEITGKPERVSRCRVVGFPSIQGRNVWPVADREAGALKRLAAIVKARNGRNIAKDPACGSHLLSYHQTDPRGCALYLCLVSQLGNSPIESTYNRGLAVSC